MSKVKVVKVPVERMGEWPADPLLDMRDEPDRPDDFSTVGWVFEFCGNFNGKNAHPYFKGKKHYCRWLIGGYIWREGKAVKEAFLKRCSREGVTFVWLFREIPPPSEQQIRQIGRFNASLRRYRDEMLEVA